MKKRKLLFICALLVSVITLSGAVNRSFRTEMERWNPIGFTQARSGSQTTNRLTAGSAILSTVATEAPSGELRGGSENVITFTTSMEIGEEVTLKMIYTGSLSLSGMTGTPESGKWITYTLTSQTVTIRGNVTFLDCSRNQLTALDVSRNTALKWLYCYNNQLTALDVSNSVLQYLYCYGNQLTALDVSKNTALNQLSCSNNQLTALDVSKNTALTMLYCDGNQLTALNLFQNTALVELSCYSNQIQGEKMTRLVNSLPDRTGKEAGKFYVVQAPAPEGNLCFKSDVAIAKGKNWNTLKYKSDIPTSVLYEGEELNIISFTTTKSVGETVRLRLDYTGFAPLLTGATGVHKSGKYVTYTLTSQNVTICANVTGFNCSGNQITSLDVSQNTALTKLECNNNQLTALDVSKNTALTRLSCYGNQLTVLDVSENIALTRLTCSNNELSALDVSKNTALTELRCIGNQLTTLDLSQNTALKWFSCGENQLTVLDLSKNTELITLYCNSNQLTALDLSQNSALSDLSCRSNQLTALDLSQNTALNTLYCGNNQLTALDLSKCPSLWVVHCYGNQIQGEEMTRLVNSLLDRSGKDAGTFVVTEEPDAEGNLCLKSDVAIAKSKNWNTRMYKSDTDEYVAYEGEELSPYIISFTTTKAIGEKITLYIRDTGSAPLLTGATGKHKSGEYVTYTLTSPTVTIRGNVTGFNCSGNQITTLDVSKNTALTQLLCSSNQLNALDLSQNSALTWLYCGYNQLTALDLSKNTALTDLNCIGNQLTTLDLSQNSALTRLRCDNNQLTTLNLSQNRELFELYCAGNQLTALDLSQNAALTELICYNNQLTALDLSKCASLTTVRCHGNQIKVVEMTRLVNSLPDRMGKGSGSFIVIQEPASEGNRCLKTDVAIAKGKNWNTYKHKSDTHNDVPYEGEEPILYAVTLTKDGEGTLTATGAADLNAVPEGTELTIEATPKETSELTSLTANDTDILATKKFVVTGATEVKATFTEKRYAVTLTQEGEGILRTTGADDLNNVLYGTELTIVATSADGYTLESLTANGTDILATQKVVVTGATEVKATFAKKRFAVTLSKEGNGMLDVTGAADLSAVPYETELTIVTTPAEGYEHTSLTANGTDILTSKKVVVKEDTEVKAIFTKKTFTVKLTQEGEGTLTPTGADDLNAVPYGTELTIEATPAEGYNLTALTANGADILATKKVVVKGATEVKATFAKKTFAVTLSKEGEGTLTPTGADDLNAVPYGTELTIEATPAEGYNLTALTANGADILATKKVVVKGATEVKATFAKKTFAVTLSKEGEGTLTATGADNLDAVPYGTELTIVATPAVGYTLVAFTANGADILATKKVVVKGATEVKATFAKKTFAVTLSKEGEGTLTATGAANLNAVPYGTELTIVATPAVGYTLVAFTANGADILATKKVVVKGATEVKATFAKKTFAVTLTKEGEGTLTATGADNLDAVLYGTELTIEATPAEGYELKALTANDTDILATKKFTVTADTEVKATFAKKTFAVTLSKEGEGTLTATGADNLDAVPYGTELTIEATPAVGYTLVAFTANGADILATKKVVVKGATEVKATFAKKTFAVTLSKEGEGTLTATGADNLDAVPYGTELTIEATPAEGYELKALTANDTDILATKKFTVTADTEVKATFTKKTAADIVNGSSVRLYPNPASAYVNVKAAKADALVRLYDANGTLQYEARTDADGTLQIDLSAYAEGTYLLRVGDDAQRLLIQR